MTYYDDYNHTWAKRFKNGDKQALEESIDVFGPSLQILVKRILTGVGSAEDMEECVSDVFLAAWHGIDRYEESRASFRTWLLILTKYKSLDLRRKLLRQGDRAVLRSSSTLVRSENYTERDALTRESTREVIAYIKEMTEPDRSLFWRRYFHYESLDELTAAFGLTRKAIESRLYRCRSALKQALSLTDAEWKEDPNRYDK